MSGAPLLEVLSEKTNLENRTQSCYRKNWRCRRTSPQKKGKYFVCRDKRVNRFPRTGVFLRVLRRAALTFTTSLVIPFHQPLINCSWWRVFLGGGVAVPVTAGSDLPPPPPVDVTPSDFPYPPRGDAPRCDEGRFHILIKSFYSDRYECCDSFSPIFHQLG